MDRSLWSTLAVHYAHDPARLETLLPLFAVRGGPPGGSRPDDRPGSRRRDVPATDRGKSGAEQELDAASPTDEAFHLREREFYHWLSDQGLNVVFLDATRARPKTCVDGQPN